MKNNKIDGKILKTEEPAWEDEDSMHEDKKLIFFEYLYIGLHFLLVFFVFQLIVALVFIFNYKFNSYVKILKNKNLWKIL